ncbi:MAG: DUF484 family protein [Mariprofundaceae bacterium]
MKLSKKSKIKDHSVRRLQQLAEENHKLRQYVSGVMDRLHENEKLFSRLFELETEVLAASDVEEMCFVLLRGLHNRFKLDSVRFWFDRTSFIGGHKMEAVSERDLVWVEAGEIKKMGLAEQQVCLLNLGPENGFAWMESRDEHLRSLALLTLGDLSKPFGVLGMGSVDPDRFQPDQATDFLQHLALIVSSSLENTIIRERVARLAITDSITGNFNRRFLQPNSQQPLSQWFGKDVEVACLYVEIDNFKLFTEPSDEDAHGNVLELTSRTIGSKVRSQDPLVSMGDAKFSVLLPGCPMKKASEIGQRIIDACGEMEIDKHHISLSAGLTYSSADQDMRLKDLLAGAEHAMYVAKALGGGRLETSED